VQLAGSTTYQGFAVEETDVMPDDASVARAAIVVPCFNDGLTLTDAVHSVRRDPSATELVVVDDGSTDHTTSAVLARLEDDGVRVIRQANQGPSAATMAGLEATSAPYVMRLDADDMLESGAIAALATALDQTPEAAAAWGDVQTFGATTFRIPGIPALDAWLITYVNCIPGAGCLLRRAAVVESGGWQLRDGFEDWDLWMALSERDWRGIHVPCVAFRYRRDEGGRHLGSLHDADAHYQALRRRHELLFSNRRRNQLRSNAPAALKVMVPLVEALPGVPRLVRIQLCELITRLLWGGGLRAAAHMIRQALVLRIRRVRGAR
jgi:glycosyltransferase involved in cell wall biosynthesis